MWIIGNSLLKGLDRYLWRKLCQVKECMSNSSEWRRLPAIIADHISKLCSTADTPGPPTEPRQVSWSWARLIKEIHLLHIHYSNAGFSNLYQKSTSFGELPGLEPVNFTIKNGSLTSLKPIRDKKAQQSWQTSTLAMYLPLAVKFPCPSYFAYFQVPA